ncbi:hypothetical protein [Rubrivirga sp.]|uniref:hypothetical protein n=1 Tax=Rubrivirga sp. TaxID=1885344 RepID=UPI003C7636E7
MRLVEVQYGFDELRDWHRAVLDADTGSLVGSGVQQSRNRLRLLVASDGDVAAVWALTAAMGIPSDAVVVEVAGEPVTEQSSLESSFDPVPGGVFFTDPERSGGCTIGYNLVVDGTRNKFITNSHCTEVFGGTDPFHYVYQPNTFSSANLLAFETLDRPFSSNVPGCPRGSLCRTSDAAIFQYSSQSTKEPEYAVARPRRLNDPTRTRDDIDQANPRFIVRGVLTPFEGDIVMTVGQQTGWRSGQVTEDEQTVKGPGRLSSAYVLLRQVEATYTSTDGDSGGPVFVAIASSGASGPNNGTTTDVSRGVFPVGIHVGSYTLSNGATRRYFSALDEAFDELLGGRDVNTIQF